MGLTKQQARRSNCIEMAKARRLKARQLEREIQQSSATDGERANMLHTLSKLGIFSDEERDQLARLAGVGPYYEKWLRIPVDGSS